MEQCAQTCQEASVVLVQLDSSEMLIGMDVANLYQDVHATTIVLSTKLVIQLMANATMYAISLASVAARHSVEVLTTEDSVIAPADSRVIHTTNVSQNILAEDTRNAQEICSASVITVVVQLHTNKSDPSAYLLAEIVQPIIPAMTTRSAFTLVYQECAFVHMDMFS